ncbi:GMP synthase (glutamine-hydrolyzing), partial [Acinetobacter baumannii]
KQDVLFHHVSNDSQVWMSHSDSITQLPEGFELLATTESIPVAAFKKSADQTSNTQHPLYGIQFHAEVYHSTEGKQLIKNFLVDVCGCSQN